ncbi:MAG: DUF2946 family protein [Pseudorhodoplanes sp.]
MAGVFPRTRIRAAIGLIAAYAIALQTLFAAFAPMPANAAGIDFGQVICFGSGNASAPAGDDGAPAPASGKLHCVLCVASGTAAILPEPLACPLAQAAKRLDIAPAKAEIFLAPLAARSGPARAPPLTL